MFEILQFVHSWLRWIVLILGIYVIIKSFMGWKGNKVYEKTDNALSGAFMGTLHLQLLIGLALYAVYSPIVQGAFNDFGAAMKDSAIRYWAVEHILIMVIAIVIAQIGRIKSKKAITDALKFKKAAIFYLIALLLMLSRIPFGEAERLFRGL